MKTTKAMHAIKTIHVDDIDLVEAYYENDPTAQIDFAMPLTPGAAGATDLAAEDCVAVYFALDPGRHLPTHIDSEEELLLCMSGTVTVNVDGEEATLSEGELAVLPKKAPHGVRNEGDERATVLGFFPAGEVHHEFGEPVMPVGKQYLVTKPDVDGE